MSGDPRLRVQPAHTQPGVGGFIRFLGGTVGRYGLVGGVRWWTPLRVLIAVAFTFLSFGYLSKAACLGSWEGHRQYVTACYNDILPLYDARGLNQPGNPYSFSWVEDGITRYMEYPVLSGLFQGVIGALTRLTHPLVALPEASWYFTLTALALSVLWVLTIRLVVELTGNRVWDGLLVAASPLIIVHAFTNWDILAIFLAVAAMYAVAKNKPGWGGVFIGLGVSAKLWPLFLLGAYLVLAFRQKRWRPWIIMVASAAASWLLVNLPIMLKYPEAWAEFTRLNSTRSWEWTTIWAVASRSFGWTGFDPATAEEPVILNTVTLVLFALSCVAIAIFGWKVQRQPRVAELIVLILIAFLMFNKVYSPQYSLWLIIPAVLALPRWRLLYCWMIADMMVWPILMWHMMGEENLGAPAWMLDVAILTRDGFILAIAVLVIQQMRGKTIDPVLVAHDQVDPLAGPFTHKEHNS